MTKTVKIVIDICMTILLILLVPTARTNKPLHTILGFAIIPLVALHLYLNGKWLVGSIKNLMDGKLNKKARYMLKLVIGLMIAFSICAFTGVFIYLSGATRDTMRPVYRLHGLSGVAWIVLTVFHVKVHWNYLKAAFRKKNSVIVKTI
jgi:hypothetical protein